MNTISPSPSLLPALAFLLLSIFPIALLDEQWVGSAFEEKWEHRRRRCCRRKIGRGYEEVAGGSSRTAPMFLGEYSSRRREGEGEGGWKTEMNEEERTRWRRKRCRAAQACSSSRLESRRIPKRNTPLRPRHGSHASVSSDWPPVPNFPLRFLTRAHWTRARLPFAGQK